MSRLEKFGLIAGIIGLVADVIGLISFLAGIWTPQSPNSSSGGLPLIYQVVFAFAIIYGWLSISWTLVRRSFSAREYTKQNFASVVFRTTFGIGIIVIPLTIAWWATIARGENVRMQTEWDERVSLQATQTAQTTPTSVTSDDPEEELKMTSSQTGAREPVDESPLYYIFCFPIVHIIVGIGLFFVLVLIMPMVYADMPEVTFEEVFAFLDDPKQEI